MTSIFFTFHSYHCCIRLVSWWTAKISNELWMASRFLFRVSFWWLPKAVNTSLESIRFRFGPEMNSACVHPLHAIYWIGDAGENTHTALFPNRMSPTCSLCQIENENTCKQCMPNRFTNLNSHKKKLNMILKRRYNSIWFTLNNHSRWFRFGCLFVIFIYLSIAPQRPHISAHIPISSRLIHFYAVVGDALIVSKHRIALLSNGWIISFMHNSRGERCAIALSYGNWR